MDNVIVDHNTPAYRPGDLLSCRHIAKRERFATYILSFSSRQKNSFLKKADMLH